MARKNEKMDKLIAERERLRKQIESLQFELKGLERAISLLGGEDTASGTASAKTRATNVKGTILAFVNKAGPDGINVNGVLDSARETGINLERGTVSSLLSRLKRDGVLDMRDGKYFVPLKEVAQATAH